ITDNVGNNGGGVTMGGGTFSMTGGSITGNDGNYNGGGVFMGSGTFSMTGGSITGNSAGTSGGGGVAISGGTFMISGGSITGNSAEAKGNGVCMTAGAFKISGNAVIASNNDVYLDSGRRITVSGEITAEDEFIATITPSSYSTGTLVMSAENGVALEDIVSKFAVTPNGTESWKIATDGTLMKDEGL
ncbi:MAG: hypothetical protein J6R96_04685, partial [Spirochaetaceae bacterium]|nr:hypothetical protein [Spirochaetaceae bacterium]